MVELRPGVYDSYLINFDFMLFGFNPTQYLHGIANPVLTEFLQILYAIFYLMPVIYGLELYLWQRYDEFKYATFVIFFGFYLSFFGYLILPSIGPRFTLHNFANLNNELPGLFFTNFLRELINLGESIPAGTVNPELVAQRDAFPSGHTIIMIIITYLSHKIKSKSFYFYLPYTALLIFTTVYMRYHYVVDLMGGAVIAVFTIWITNFIYKKRSV